MKQTVYRYGIYAALVIVLGSLISLLLIGKNVDYDTQEILGYLVIFLSMIFVFLGIRHFRDRVNAGILNFGQGLKVGLLIVLIPSVFFGLFDVLYTYVINPEWKQDYYAHYIEKVKASTPPEKLAATLKEVEEQKELFSSPVMEFLLMSLTVFVIGAVVSIIAALSLRRNKKI